MLLFFADQPRVVEEEPDAYPLDGGFRVERLGKNARVRGDTEKPEEYDPRQARWIIAANGLLPPFAQRRVMYRVFVDGLKEYVQVDDLHFRSTIFRKISSSSSAAASASARRKSTRGVPIG